MRPVLRSSFIRRTLRENMCSPSQRLGMLSEIVFHFPALASHLSAKSTGNSSPSLTTSLAKRREFSIATETLLSSNPPPREIPAIDANPPNRADRPSPAPALWLIGATSTSARYMGTNNSAISRPAPAPATAPATKRFQCPPSRRTIPLNPITSTACISMVSKCHHVPSEGMEFRTSPIPHLQQFERKQGGHRHAETDPAGYPA
jgi:hypothetical protein